MSDEQVPEEKAPEGKVKNELFTPTATPGTPTAPPSMLTRGSDMPVKPGFRSPANKNSKAQKSKKK